MILKLCFHGVETPFKIATPLMFHQTMDSVPIWYGTISQRRQLNARPASPALSSQSYTSIGSLTILILIKFITWNFSKPRDLFGHELCGGVFCNLAASIKGLHWQVL